MSSEDEVAITIQGVCSQTAPIGALLRLLDSKERGQVLEACLARALEWFWREYGSLRFKPYAKAKLGYHIKKKSEDIKEEAAKQYPDAVLPNVRSGSTRTDVANGWRVETRLVGGSRSGVVVGVLKIPVPGYIVASTSNKVSGPVLTKISNDEGEAICSRFFKEVQDASQRFVTTEVKTRGGKMKPRTTSGSADAGVLGLTNRSRLASLGRRATQGTTNG